VQACLRGISEQPIAGFDFVIDADMIEALVEDRVIPCLLQQHLDVRDTTAGLLQFVIGGAVELKEAAPAIVARVAAMIAEKERRR
jgi:hypothetical protein